MLKRDQKGFSLIELLIVVAIIGIIAAIAVPQLMNAMDRGRQRRSMADMRNIATANGTMRVDTGAYATVLGDLVPTWMQVTPTDDGWGNPYIYAQIAAAAGAPAGYSIESEGALGAPGPDPPAGTWINEPYDGDIMLVNGMFTQAPTGQ